VADFAGTPAGIEFRKRSESRLGGLRSNRYSWYLHWRELAQFILPRRYKWLVTPNQANRGSPINQAIINNTGTIAARTLAGGLFAGLANPMTPWFKFKIDGYEDESSEVVRWLAESAKRMQRVFQESNFYNSLAIEFFDLIVFGTATTLIYEDYENVINCYNPALGEFYIDLSPKLEGAVFAREFVRTVDQIVTEFGIDNCSPDVKRAYNEGGTALTREHVIVHMLEPNTRMGDGRLSRPRFSNGARFIGKMDLQRAIPPDQGVSRISRYDLALGHRGQRSVWPQCRNGWPR
jgi:hypothetical protein